MPKNLVGEPLLCCFSENFRWRKSLWIRGGGGLKISIEIILSHSAEKFRRGESFSVSLNSGIEKVWIAGGRGSITIFRRSFCLTVPKYFLGEHFGVSEQFFYQKFSCIAVGATRFCRNFFSQDRNEKLCKGTLLFSRKVLVSKKVMDKRGHITIFSRSFYFSQCRKISWASFQCFRKLGYRKILCIIGVSRFSLKFFCLTVSKNSVGIPSMFQKK